MGVYDNFADKPNQINVEGQEITLRFKRNGDGTGLVSWNIPPSSNGCGVQGAYDGIVITVSDKPVNYLTNSPKNSEYYTGDATVDFDLNTGDDLDGAKVVFAKYHDTTTTSFLINDVKERTPYFFSGYAVDGVGRYHRAGVHSYSLPTSIDEFARQDYYAKHEIFIDVLGGITNATHTGLSTVTTYTQKFEVNRKNYTITVEGADCYAYDDLVDAINKEFMKLDADTTSVLIPLKDTVYVNPTNKIIEKFDGYYYSPVNSFFGPKLPTLITTDDFWVNGNALKRYDGSLWNDVSYINSKKDPSVLSCNTVWVNTANDTAWIYNGSGFESLQLITSNISPLNVMDVGCGAYWFDSSISEIKYFNVVSKQWEIKNFVLSDIDPNVLNTGNYWFDLISGKVKRYVGGVWNNVTGTIYAAPTISGEPDSTAIIVANKHWFDTVNQKLYKRDSTNTIWELQSLAIADVLPSDRSLSSLWWNSDTDILKIWDELLLQWVDVNNFYQSQQDPSLPPTFTEDVLWFDGTTYTLITQNSCLEIDVITADFPPPSNFDNLVWFDGESYFLNNVGDWDDVFPFYSSIDPLLIPAGYYFYNYVNQTLYYYDGTTYSIAPHVTEKIYPLVGYKWFNLNNDTLYMWNGGTWVSTFGIMFAALLHPLDNSVTRSILGFYTRDKGCKYGIKLLPEAGDLITSLVHPIIYLLPVVGANGVESGPLYKQIGVGDDGSPDERRDIHAYIRSSLGGSSAVVELTKDDIDNCINNAVLELRKYSSYSSKRGMFFLDLQPKQQTYILTDSCVGFNKIIDIRSIHRMRGGLFKGGFGNDLHMYAALQQLYTLGTFDILTYHLTASYMEDLEMIFASKILFQWYEYNRELKIYQAPYGVERVLIDCTIEVPEQELMLSRQTALWLKRWALAEAKTVLSFVRGKYTNLPGPNGSTVLNSGELYASAVEEKEKLKAELEDAGAMQDLINIGLNAHLVIG